MLRILFAMTMLLLSTALANAHRYHNRYNYRQVVHQRYAPPQPYYQNFGFSPWSGNSYTPRDSHYTPLARQSYTPSSAYAYHPSSAPVSIAENFLGASGAIVGMSRQWCGAFMRMVMRRSGNPDFSEGNAAVNWRHYGSPSSPAPGTIAVAPHHVGLVKAVQGNKVLLVSGNHGHRVGEGWYPMHRFVAFRSPAGGGMQYHPDYGSTRQQVAAHYRSRHVVHLAHVVRYHHHHQRWIYGFAPNSMILSSNRSILTSADTNASIRLAKS